MAKANRRQFLTKSGAVAAAAAVPAAAQTSGEKPKKEIILKGGRKQEKPPEKIPRFNSVVTYGDLVFISGIGAHFKGDIKAHTKHVLDEIEARLKDAGSSMEKVLKVNVYLNDLKDYDAMNEVYQGRFGPEPGVRTTIAAAGGIRETHWVEIDCIAHK